MADTRAERTEEIPVLEFERRYPAAPERVWRAWTQPEALSRWFGTGDPAAVTEAVMDVRPGGAYTIAFRSPDGESHRVSGIYDDVEPLRRLVFSWAWQSTPERVSRVCVELEPDGTGTVMRLRHDRFHDAQGAKNHLRGWTTTLEKFAAALASASAAVATRNL